MRIANLLGRAHLLCHDGAIDIAAASGEKFGPDLMNVYAQWTDFIAWAHTETTWQAKEYSPTDLQAPVPRPRQVFAIGVNYAQHAEETGIRTAPGVPLVFTKYATSLTGPNGDVVLSGSSVDWEVEVVVVIGQKANNVAAEDAWHYVAGLTVGQDFSDRDVQMSGDYPQFSLGKSFPGYGPTGPAVVTLDELPPDTPLRLRCWVNDELVQDGSTDQMTAPVPVLIEHISGVCTLFPGDLIFTGTPAGVGMGRTPARYLKSGDTVRTCIDGVGEMLHTMISARA
jgi:2-keto-4-pentenoate hydratase/2-oxohepta-3-ene-1,7-dioic acid hydratase in catechol pathway